MTDWRAMAERLRPRPEGDCLIGFSGGADSTALLKMLIPLQREGILRLTAIHVHHGLRGADADGDEAFARKTCEKEGIPFRSVRVDLCGRSDEDAAREARYEAFRDCMRKERIPVLILAHHREDQAETFLMRLMRGAGPEGLGCMRPEETRDGYRILRPLLDFSRDELRAALEADGQPWREDGSNRDSRYFRNRIRAELLPRMEAMIPGAAGRIAAAAEMIALEGEALEGEAAAFLRAHAAEGRIRRAPLLEVPEALRRRIVRRWWREAGPKLPERELNREQTEALSRLIREDGARTVNLPGGWRASRGREWIHLESGAENPPEAELWREADILFGAFRLKTEKSRGTPGDGKREQEVPAGFPEGCEIRTRRPGDRIRPFGMAGSKSLQDYLTDRGIDRAFRDRIPLLCRGKEVIWAAGVGAGAVPPWDPGKKNIRLRWEGDMPWAGEGGKE